MKLHEITDVPLIVSMARKLLDKDIPVQFDFDDKQRDYTRFARGALKRITIETLDKLPDKPTVYRVSYKTPELGVKDYVMLNDRRLALLKLYKNKDGQWMLSDKKPETSDEAI